MGKKGVINQIIGIFILVLVVSVLAGMTFLFVSALKDNVETSSPRTTVTVTNETPAWINGTTYTVLGATNFSFGNAKITEVWNGSTKGKGFFNLTLASTQYTITSSTGIVENKTNTEYWNVSISYTFTGIYGDDKKAYLAVNATEQAGFNVTKYLTILFLALIFGAILVVVLRVILPYMNLGQQVGTGW